jgi:hypothetical protein
MEILELAQRLERLTHDTLAWYAGTRARVEARAALGQATIFERIYQRDGHVLHQGGAFLLNGRVEGRRPRPLRAHGHSTRWHTTS